MVVVYEPVYSVIYPPQSIHAGINMGRSTVPVIAVFTKYDQFRLSIEMNLEDHGCSNSEAPTMNLCERSILLYEHPRLH